MLQALANSCRFVLLPGQLISHHGIETNQQLSYVDDYTYGINLTEETRRSPPASHLAPKGALL